jgi:hypothetical protein
MQTIFAICLSKNESTTRGGGRIKFAEGDLKNRILCIKPPFRILFVCLFLSITQNLRFVKKTNLLEKTISTAKSIAKALGI